MAKPGSEAGRARPNQTSGKEPTEEATARAIVLVPVLRSGADTPEYGDAPRHTRSPEARLAEALGLALAIDLDVAASAVITVAEPRPATLLGSGKVEEIATMVADTGAGLVVVDHPLTPVQQRNLEKATGAKVLDRTGLILEIFGRRARTREGALQVEHAHLTYQKGRLVRSWTHLERQRGGFGFLGGPGETQIEADRRMLSERIGKIESDLEKVKRTRKLHRESRKRVPYPIVALVGYTNAGKSTLFNRMTAASVLSADMLFATLDPTLRSIDLPHGTRIILSDTVGFISDLPTQLVAAFRATLEEVIEADIILHVRDMSHEDTGAQSADVAKVLGELGIEPTDRRIIEVWNKIDALDADGRERIHNLAARQAPERAPIIVSALTGEGIDSLTGAIENRLGESRQTLSLRLDASDGAGLSWLYRHTEVLDKTTDDEGHVSVTVRATPDKAGQVRAKFAL